MWTAWKREVKARNAAIRSERMARARAIASHTAEEWAALCEEMENCCVICGIHATALHGNTLTKDHIVPIYQGGSDGIENLQPACRTCNSRKGPDSFNWVAFRRENGFR